MKNEMDRVKKYYEIEKKVLEPEMDGIVREVKKKFPTLKIDGDEALNRFDEYFPQEFSYYQGMLQGLLLVGVIDDVKECWAYFEERLADVFSPEA